MISVCQTILIADADIEVTGSGAGLTDKARRGKEQDANPTCEEEP